MKSLIYILGLVLIYNTSCKNTSDKNNKVLANSVGAINNITLVMENHLWKGAVGDTLRRYFAAPVTGLPWDEPLFNIDQMPKKIFTGFARNMRSIVIVNHLEKKNFFNRTNVYAKPQRVIYISGNTEEELIAEIQKQAPQAIAALKNTERKENQKRFLRSLSKETALQDIFGIRMRVPSYYKVVKKENNFVWIERSIKSGTIRGTMGIIAYTMPKNHFKNDSTRLMNIIKMRDSIGKLYIPGPDVEKNYMITEKAYSPSLSIVEINHKKAFELKGMWEMFGYPMAGPFINYVIEDETNNRCMVIEGFIFAPNTEKRNYMFELEAILNTVTFDQPSQ